MLIDSSVKFISEAVVLEVLDKALFEGVCPTFRYNSGANLRRAVARLILREINKTKDPAAFLQICCSLIKNHDYRLTADFLYHEKKADHRIAELYGKLMMANNEQAGNHLKYDIRIADFQSENSKKVLISLLPVKDFSKITTTVNNGTVAYLSDEHFRELFLRLFEDVGGQIGEFIERQFDLPALNALVNQGVVKTWHFPDGTKVVSKRTNPKKRGKLFDELRNYAKITQQIRSNSQLLSQDDLKTEFKIKITPPFAVIADAKTGFYYALSKAISGTTLEDILLKEQGQKVRERYIGHYRQILDTLFNHGILWGDMTPRNIIVEHVHGQLIYNLLDFEKTSVTTHSLELKDRKMQCRGQLFAEEFCLLCSPAEVQKYFGDYFNPAEWDLNSDRKPDFYPRPEVSDIMRGRNLRNVTLGEYNRLDLDMLNARIPNGNNKNPFPGYINFKVEHYLSCANFSDASDYERKTTEILIFAKKQNYYDSVVELLTETTDAAEAAIVLSEFSNLLARQPDNYVPPPAEIEFLVKTIDKLYQLRNDEPSFGRFIRKARSVKEFE